MQDYKEFLGEILISEEKLQARVAELGAQISRDYVGKNLMLVCILRGGVMFLTDLMRKISIPHTIEFMAISSYGVGARESSGHVRINYDLSTDIGERDVLIVEDIVDSGHTLAAVLRMLSLRNPRSLNVCALLDKAERREVEVPIRYQGFAIPDRFVFGYGLDIDDHYRQLPFIGVVDLSKMKRG
ncbi:MAG TPA: hypoxanthine phosphoribosyltransferase [Anaerolineaceae bacterium]|nr:hypoxanthine phosphoribosyltransferase [Anaerolineaceae bacterium]